MIEIKKGTEPPELTAYRKQPFATYADMPQDVRSAIIEKLIQEQGGVCAYCMCRIPQKGRTPKVSIEHWEPQSETDENKALEYNNMLAVCSGNRGCGSERDMTCDAKRGNKLLIVNPLRARTLSSIQYRANGVIFSDIKSINTDLNDTLNLNCTSVGLVESRRRVLQGMQKCIQKKHPTGDIKLYCKRLLAHYQELTPKPAYLGILIWWLEKKTRN